MADAVAYIAGKILYGCYLLMAYMDMTVILSFLTGVLVCVGVLLVRYIVKRNRK